MTETTKGMDFWMAIVIDTICVISSSFYVLYYISSYAHPNDTKWGQSILFRAFIFAGYMI